MKKLILFFVTTWFAVNLFGQEEQMITKVDPSYRIYLGPKVGLNYASMSGLPDEFGLKPKSSLGYQGGLAANVHFGRRTDKSDGGTGLFGIQLEAMYSQRTIKTDIEDMKFNYIEVPVLAQCYVTPEVCIELGPTLTGAISTSPDEMKSGNLIISTGDLKAWDVMLTAGIGYKHRSGLTMSARYNLGMSKLAENFEGKVSTVTVSIGWLFALVK